MHEALRLDVRGMSFAALRWGPADGPLALCLHGYPDTARTWRHLGPYLAAHGWRVVAPWLRGYAPTDLAPDDDYSLRALALDALALRDALGGDERAVLVGHDWGAAAGYLVRDAFRRVVTIAVPPAPALAVRVSEPLLVARQLRMSWYVFWQLVPRLSERSLDRVIPRLWRDWSPGYDASEDVAEVFRALPDRAHRRAALRYYRAYFTRGPRGLGSRDRTAPVLYLYGDRDGCLQPAVSARAAEVLRPPSRVAVVRGAGHFLHLEAPDVVHPMIDEFIGR